MYKKCTINFFKETEMKDLNSLLLEGNVVRDPVMKDTPSGKHVCTFTIGANRFYKLSDGYGEEVSYFDIETWGKLADLCGENCTTGRGVRVVGRLKQNRWTGSDGKQYSRINIVAEHVEFKPVFSKKQQNDSAVETENTGIESLEAVPAF